MTAKADGMTSELRERLAATEGTVKILADNVGALQGNVSRLHEDVQSVLSMVRSHTEQERADRAEREKLEQRRDDERAKREADNRDRVNWKNVVIIVTALGAIGSFMASQYIAPMKLQIDSLSEKLNTHSDLAGHGPTMVRFAGIEIRLAATEQKIDTAERLLIERGGRLSELDRQAIRVEVEQKYVRDELERFRAERNKAVNP